MRLEEGKRYRDGNGKVTGPLVYSKWNAWPFRDPENDDTYDEKGYCGFLADSPFNLVEEVGGEVDEVKLSLEVGKRYVSREGKVTGPLTKSNYGQWPFRDPLDGCGATFRPDGTFDTERGYESPFDLVREFTGEETLKVEDPVEEKPVNTGVFDDFTEEIRRRGDSFKGYALKSKKELPHFHKDENARWSYTPPVALVEQVNSEESGGSK
jgi:hypothetical protein